MPINKHNLKDLLGSNNTSNFALANLGPNGISSVTRTTGYRGVNGKYSDSNPFGKDYQSRSVIGATGLAHPSADNAYLLQHKHSKLGEVSRIQQ